jgi:hypothetical protein
MTGIQLNISVLNTSTPLSVTFVLGQLNFILLHSQSIIYNVILSGVEGQNGK